MRFIHADVILLLKTLHQLFDQLVQGAFHLHLLKALAHFLIEKIALKQCLFDGLSKIFKGLLALWHVIKHVILETALQQVIGKGAEQIFHAHFTGRVGNVFRVADAFHKNSGRSSVAGKPFANFPLKTDDGWLVIGSATAKR